MKRYAAFVAFIVLVLTPGTAALGQTTLLVSGGLNRASVAFSGDDVNELSENPEPAMRMWVGLAAAVPVSENWSLELGAGYSQKGRGGSFVVSEYGFEGTLEFENLLDYLEVAAHASRSFPLADRARVNLLAGPTLAMQQSCRSIFRFADEEMTEDCTDDDARRKIDLGLSGGMRIKIGLSEKVGFTVGALYTLGLLNLNTDADFDLIGKHRVLTLQAGLAYSIG